MSSLFHSSVESKKLRSSKDVLLNVSLECIRKIKWILYQVLKLDSLLTLFMSGYKWDKRDLEKSSFKASQVLHPLINKSKKKCN